LSIELDIFIVGGTTKKLRVYAECGSTTKFIYFDKEDAPELLKYLYLSNRKITQICEIKQADGMWHPKCKIMEPSIKSKRTNKQILDTFFSKL
jgi:hypothetical protein